MALTTKTKFMSGIVSVKEASDCGSLASLLKSYFDGECVIYAFIFHNQDIDENGEYKTRHFHFVCELKTARRVSTLINGLATLLNLSPFAITCDKCVSMEGAIQYLVHKNDPDKFQYPRSLVVTNMSDDDFTLYMDCETSKDEFGRLYEVICRSMSKVDVIRAIGLSKYTRYYKAIDDIWNQVHRVDVRRR